MSLRLFAATFLVVEIGCAATAPTPPGTTTERVFPIQWETHATYSRIARPLRLVIRDRATLAQLPLAEVPVDFDRQMVLVAALGPTASDEIAIRIARVWQEGSRIEVRVNTIHPGQDARPGTELTSPFHIVVVPTSDLPVDGFSASIPRGALRGAALPYLK
jgi:hypothetical protein